ncbi:hypothetical protein T265_04999 [Opisthorchis viverrini]|uniref:Uncharacterized protein n=1 Tax=Opisthorchis viverrini TaxID=6198 RepID=A0A074ZL58_OPIVI|nr:hypothetical protein T265_04999 [Opisthorchis viverrini]KER28088.1 hypothetical protein T265_04999 [Opisthorchis viverrini]
MNYIIIIVIIIIIIIIIITIIIDSMTSVFNTDASLPYNHDLFESLIPFAMPNLCTNVLLRHDFLGLHVHREISFGGDPDAFTIYGLTAVNVEFPSLFADLSLRSCCNQVETPSG